MVALVGPSGAGKSTTAMLVPRVYDVTDGAVLVGGVDVRDATLDSLRDTIGVVTQDAHLFHETIAENLRYAKPDATDDELWAALRAGPGRRAGPHRCPTGWTRWSASGATGSPAARSSASRSPGCCSRRRRS